MRTPALMKLLHQIRRQLAGKGDLPGFPIQPALLTPIHDAGCTRRKAIRATACPQFAIDLETTILLEI